MEKFGFAGLWKHIGTTVLAALLPVADAVLTYLNVVALPTWAHALVGVASAILLFYKGKIAPQTALKV
ncbi:MAG: hypothetical protein WAV13_03960 [Thermodesulfovibrionales bacterium]